MAVELARDRFVVVGATALVGDVQMPAAPTHAGQMPVPAIDLAGFPLLDCAWLPGDTLAPTWQTWVEAARQRGRTVPDLGGLAAMHFREESHMIDAVLAGQGIALCSDLLVAEALRDGRLNVLSDVSLPGYGLYFVHRRGHRREREILALLAWMTDQFRAGSA